VDEPQSDLTAALSVSTIARLSSYPGGEMLNTISARFYQLTKGWLIFILLLLDGFFSGFLLPMIQRLLQGGQGGIEPIDLQFFYTPDWAYGMMERYGAYNRLFYRNVELTVDIIYPIVYTLFFGLLISWLFQRGVSPESNIRRLNVMPVGAWFFDLLENLGIVTMLTFYPFRLEAVAWLTIAFTMIKWLFAGCSILLLLFGLAMAARNRFRILK
jgi:hypothetical protein